MKRRYYLSYRSDNYMAVVVFTNRYAANKFTEKRREIETHHMTWDVYSKVMTRKEAIGYSSHGKIYRKWQVAVRERIAFSLGERERILKKWRC